MNIVHGLKRSATRWASVAMVTMAMVTMQMAGAPPAGAVAGLKLEYGRVSPRDSEPAKTVQADCPTGKRLVGGGGWVMTDNAADGDKVMLTELRPVHLASGVDTFVVSAMEAIPNITTTWWVQAYALCADPLSGLHIVEHTGPSTATIGAIASCPPGEVALSVGGRVDASGAQIAMSRVTPNSTGNQGSVYATPGPGVNNWSVTAYAVCAPRPKGYQVVWNPAPEMASESQKVALISCPAGTLVHGTGVLGGPLPDAILDPVPDLGIQVSYPFQDLDLVEAVAVETTPSSLNWRLIAVAICAK